MNNDLHLNRSNLNDVVDVEHALLTGIKPGPVDKCTIGAIQIFDYQDALLTANPSVLARRPDSVGRFLVF
jgi:hypothetical protein